MMSRAPEMRLDNRESRRNSLANHLDYKKWDTPSPYISFTTSSTAIEDLAQMRAKRGVQTLTVIDPNSRIKNGLPILDVAAEMDYYNIPDPYGKSKEYYVNHFVCLWQVTKVEIVGRWDWSDLAANKRWYQEVIVPAFKNFAGTLPAADSTDSLSLGFHTGGCAKGDMDDLKESFNKLLCRLSLSLHFG